LHAAQLEPDGARLRACAAPCQDLDGRTPLDCLRDSAAFSEECAALLSPARALTAVQQAEADAEAVLAASAGAAGDASVAGEASEAQEDASAAAVASAPVSPRSPRSPATSARSDGGCGYASDASPRSRASGSSARAGSRAWRGAGRPLRTPLGEPPPSPWRSGAASRRGRSADWDNELVGDAAARLGDDELTAAWPCLVRRARAAWLQPRAGVQP
jgi:hypothetical protein